MLCNFSLGSYVHHMLKSFCISTCIRVNSLTCSSKLFINLFLFAIYLLLSTVIFTVSSFDVRKVPVCIGVMIFVFSYIIPFLG
jgi:hypothetical protein